MRSTSVRADNLYRDVSMRTRQNVRDLTGNESVTVSDGKNSLTYKLGEMSPRG